MAPPAADPAVFLSKLRAGIDAKTAIIQIDGRPTLVITPHTDPNNPNPAYVEFDRQGVEVNIYSNTYGTRTLLGVAQSMRSRRTVPGGAPRKSPAPFLSSSLSVTRVS